MIFFFFRVTLITFSRHRLFISFIFFTLPFFHSTVISQEQNVCVFFFSNVWFLMRNPVYLTGSLYIGTRSLVLANGVWGWRCRRPVAECKQMEWWKKKEKYALHCDLWKNIFLSSESRRFCRFFVKKSQKTFLWKIKKKNEKKECTSSPLHVLRLSYETTLLLMSFLSFNTFWIFFFFLLGIVFVQHRWSVMFVF